MVGLLAAMVVSAAPVTAVEQVAAVVLAAKKKKKKRAKPAGSKPAEKDDDEEEQENMEGLDLTEPTPAPAAEPVPSSDEPVAPTETPEPAKGDAAGWSLVTPRTVGEGANVLEGGVGWPGIYAGYTRGLLKDLDVGARVGFNWGFEGVFTGIRPGVRIQVVGKYLLTEIAGLPLGISFAPGVLVYIFPLGGPRVGLVLPIAATLGLPELVKKLSVSVTLEVPFWVLFNYAAVVPIMAGGSAEYAISDSLLAFVRLKAGVAIFTVGGAFFALEGVAGVGFHL